MSSERRLGVGGRGLGIGGRYFASVCPSPLLSSRERATATGVVEPESQTPNLKPDIHDPKSNLRHFASAILVFLALLAGCQRQVPQKKLMLYCGAGLRPPVAEIAQEFGRRHGVTVECDYAGSEVLLSRVRLTRQGDLYMPGDVSYVEQARAQGLIASSKTACYFVPVILVQQGNPKHIRHVADLVRPGIRLGLGDPKACAVGRQSTKIFARNKIAQDALRRSVVMYSLTAEELGNSVKLKALDATIVWDAVAALFAADADTVAIPPEQNVISTVPIAVLTCAREPAMAERFVAFVTSPEGEAVFRKHHYTTHLAR